MADIELSRWYPATADETFAALVAAVRELAKPQSSDDFTRSVSFATRMTGWASGANIAGSVRPEGEGCSIYFTGQAKMRTQVNANNAAHKQLVELLDRTTEWIKHNRAN